MGIVYRYRKTAHPFSSSSWGCARTGRSGLATTEERCHVLDCCVTERNDAQFRCQAGVSLALLPLLSRFGVGAGLTLSLLPPPPLRGGTGHAAV